MTEAELHIALREVVAIGRRGGYDNDEIAEKLARVAHDFAEEETRGPIWRPSSFLDSGPEGPTVATTS